MIQAAVRLPRCAGCTVARVTTPTAAKRIRTPVGGASAEPSAPNQARARYEMSRTARTATPVVGREEAGIMHLPIGGGGDWPRQVRAGQATAPVRARRRRGVSPAGGWVTHVRQRWPSGVRLSGDGVLDRHGD